MTKDMIGILGKKTLPPTSGLISKFSKILQNSEVLILHSLGKGKYVRRGLVVKDILGFQFKPQ